MNVYGRIILIGLVSIIIFGFYTYMHENVHIAINNYYDVETVSWGIDWSGAYVSHSSNDVNINDSYNLANSINDIVGYHFQALMLMMFFYIVYKECKGEC